jgi:hypothetical protein
MVAAARILALALGTALAVPQRAPAQTGDEAQLTALARAAVEAQNDILVSGDVEGSLGRRANAAAFRGGIQAHFASLTNRKNVLAQSRNDYKSHRTTLRIKNTRVEGDRATQEATEHVVLTLDPSIGGPPQTEYTQEHVLRFERAGGQWRLSADEILPPPEDPDSLRGPAVTAETRPAPAGHTPNPQIERRRAGPPRTFLDGSGLFRLASLGGRSSTRLFAYSPTAAVNYALTYWGPYNTNYNTAYREYTNDCTNFISQVVKAGGWVYDETGDRTLNNTWYYGSFTFTTSYSWAGAHNFNGFFNQSGRGFVATYFSDMLTGDILQADFGPTPDGNISHSMVVTSKDASNNIYLTYHTNNTRNRSINDLLAGNPGTRWYGLALYY